MHAANPIPGPGLVYRANERPATTSLAGFIVAQVAQNQEGQGPRKLLLCPTLHLGSGTVPTCSEATLGLPWRLGHCTPPS